MSAQSLDQLFSFEQNIESGFVALLKDAGLPNPQSSRGNAIFTTPFIELWFDNGAANSSSQQPIQGLDGAYFPFASYAGTLTTQCVTNRSDSTTAEQHNLLIGQLRAACQPYRIWKLWGKYQQIDLVTDLREAGSAYSFDEEKNLDITEIHWGVLHSINKNAWPQIDIDRIE